MDFQFVIVWAFAALPLPLLVYFAVSPSSKTGAALRIPFYQQIAVFQANQKSRSSLLRLLILLLCWGLLVTATARPQLIGDYADVPVSGRDLMLAVDVSGSMKARDMIYNGRAQDRLSAVKRVAGEFIQRRIGDRIGLILFGTRAYLQAPLSLDRKTVDLLLQESAIGIAGEKTAIGDAIGLGLKRLKDRPGNDKVMVLLTDGANTAGIMHPGEAAKLAALGELRIHTIGVGADPNRNQSGFGSLFGRGSDLDEETLRFIASQTGGRYFRATDGKSLQQIYQLIDALEPVEQQQTNLRPVKELFYWPLGAFLLLSMLWSAISCWRQLPGLTVAE